MSDAGGRPGAGGERRGAETGTLLVLLQFSDGLFPAGGFAHSFGLETYTQAGLVRDREGLEAFLAAYLDGMAGPADAVAAAVASRAAGAADAAAWREVDECLEAMKCVPEFRAASRQMGRQTARIAALLREDPFMTRLWCSISDGDVPGHHAAVFGAAMGRNGVDPESVAAALLYASSALIVNAAMRLIRLGQGDAQHALARARERIARLAADAARAGVADMWSFAPGLERAGLRHAALDMRLFRS